LVPEERGIGRVAKVQDVASTYAEQFFKEFFVCKVKRGHGTEI
jgi:hypothetical protein